jgi:hypothetical protein
MKEGSRDSGENASNHQTCCSRSEAPFGGESGLPKKDKGMRGWKQILFQVKQKRRCKEKNTKSMKFI